MHTASMAHSCVHWCFLKENTELFLGIIDRCLLLQEVLFSESDAAVIRVFRKWTALGGENDLLDVGAQYISDAGILGVKIRDQN